MQKTKSKYKEYKFVLFYLLMFFGTLLWAKFSYAADFKFQSSVDSFTVSVEDGVTRYNGEVVRGDYFSAIKPLFDLTLAEDCEKIRGRPDLTITKSLSENEEKRQLYFDKGVISNGSTKCATITGNTMYTLPLHRNWFIGKDVFTIALNNGFSIHSDNNTIVEFVKTKKGFRNKNQNFFTNWDFFAIFRDALNEVKIDYRMHPAGAKDVPGFELKTGNKTYKFLKVGEKTWGVQLPGSPWIAASGQLGIFQDMRPVLWISPLEKQLKILKDPAAKLDVRQKALSTIRGSSSLDLKVVLQDMLVDPNEPNDLKSDIVSLFKHKPTDDNFSALVDALSATKDVSLLNHITKTLRVKNPKGPIIEDNEEAITYLPKIREWEIWQKTLTPNKKI